MTHSARAVTLLNQPVTDPNEHATAARKIIDANLYMVLGTADDAGRPWASPVYFAVAGDRVSSPMARHSRNIVARPDIGIVIFDSGVPIGAGQGIYMVAVAEQVPDGELDRDIQIFSERSVAHGGRPFTRDDVSGDSGIRMYRAVVSEHTMLAKDGQPDHRVNVDLADHRSQGRRFSEPRGN